MDKLMYFFHRRPGFSREQFFDHYLNRHAPLGMQKLLVLDAYTVNLADVVDLGTAEPDAVTEVWSESAADFMTPDIAFATPEDAEAVIADHDSLFGEFDVYQVAETIVRRTSPPGPLGARSPYAKRIALYGPGEHAPAPGPGVMNVVENRVVHELMTTSAPVELIVITTAATAAELGPAGTSRAYEVGEYRQIDLPQAERANA
jgi:hypothetical protein